MFKILALAGAIAGGATYGLYAHTDLFNSCNGKCPLTGKGSCCSEEPKVTPPCCATPCPDCSKGCDGCPICEVDCSACCGETANATCAVGGIFISAVQDKKPDASKCVELCKKCAKECEACAKCCIEAKRDACAKECQTCARMCLVCAELCIAKSPLAADACKLCEKLCKDCLAMCEKSDAVCCKDCAKVCKECAKACEASRK